MSFNYDKIYSGEKVRAETEKIRNFQELNDARTYLTDNKKTEITQAGEKLKNIKNEPLKEKIKSTRDLISSSAKEITNATKEQHTPAQKAIKEKYIKHLHDELKELVKLEKGSEEIKHTVKELTGTLETSNKMLDKIIKDIDHVTSKRNKFSSFISLKNPLRSKQKQNKIEETREGEHLTKLKKALVEEETSGSGYVSSGVINKIKNKITDISKEKGEIAETISSVQARIEKEKNAVENRITLAGRVRNHVTWIDSNKMTLQLITRNSSPDLRSKIEEINNMLSVNQAYIKEIEALLIDEPIGEDESEFYQLKYGEFAHLSREAEDLLADAAEKISWRPKESSLSQNKRVTNIGLRKLSYGSSKSSETTKSDRPVSEKEAKKIHTLNVELGVLLKDFNSNKSLDFARGVLGVKVLGKELSAGDIFGELEDLKIQIDELRKKIGEPNLSKENILELKNLERQYADLSNFNTTKMAAAKLLYFDPIRDKILVCSNQLLDYKGAPNELKMRQFESDANFVKTYLIDEMLTNLIGKKDITFPDELNENLRIFQEITNPNITIKERIAIAESYREIHTTAQNLGGGIQSKYIQAFGEGGSNLKTIYTKGITNSIPTIHTRDLEPFYKSLGIQDANNKENYNLAYVYVQTAASSLDYLKGRSPSLTVKELIKELEDTESTLSYCQDKILKMEFDEEIKYVSGLDVISLAELNKNQLLIRLSEVSNSLKIIKKHLTSFENKDEIIKEIPVDQTVLEKTFEDGHASIATSTAVYTGTLTLEARDEFVKNVLAFFSDRDIKLPYGRGPKEKDWFVILDEETGKLRKIDPKTKNEEEKKIINNLKEMGNRIAFSMERVGIVKEF